MSANQLTEEEQRHTAIGRAMSSIPYDNNPERHAVSVCAVPCSCETLPTCLQACICYVPTAVAVRYRALNHVYPGTGWQHFKSGLSPNGTSGFDCCDKQCPCACMVCEAFCLPAQAAAASSLLIRQHHQIPMDEDDLELARCSGCSLKCCMGIACFCCLCGCLMGCCTDWDCCTDCCCHMADADLCCEDAAFCCCAPCLTAQCDREIHVRRAKETMERGG